jgi:purine-binding chemotaxis protein CheW
MTTLTISRLVTFRVGADLFAADIQSVERVLRYAPPRRIPHVPDWIEGVLQYEGRVLPVIDLRRRFGIAAREATAQTRLVVMSAGGCWIAAVVDQVLDVRPIAPNEIAPPPPLVRGLAGTYLHGVVSRNGQLVVVLDTERIFNSIERLTLSSVDETVSGTTDDDPVPTDV